MGRSPATPRPPGRQPGPLASARLARPTGLVRRETPGPGARRTGSPPRHHALVAPALATRTDSGWLGCPAAPPRAAAGPGRPLVPHRPGKPGPGRPGPGRPGPGRPGPGRPGPGRPGPGRPGPGR